MVVKGHYAERARRGGGEDLPHVLDLRLAHGPSLLLPRPDRVEAAGDDALGAVDRLQLRPGAAKLVERPRETPRGPARDVVVARNDEQRGPEGAEELRGSPVLSGSVAVREVAAHDDKLGSALRHERAQVVLHLRLFLR